MRDLPHRGLDAEPRLRGELLAEAEPLGRLRDGASAIGQGDLAYRIEIPGDDEFRQLADSFNEMTGKLLRSRQQVAKEIEELRREIL